jgi:hypothetical protein
LGMILKMAEGTETHKARKKEYIFHIVYSLGRAHSYSTLLFCPSKVYHIASCFVVS